MITLFIEGQAFEFKTFMQVIKFLSYITVPFTPHSGAFISDQIELANGKYSYVLVNQYVDIDSLTEREKYYQMALKTDDMEPFRFHAITEIGESVEFPDNWEPEILHKSRQAMLICDEDESFILLRNDCLLEFLLHHTDIVDNW